MFLNRIAVLLVASTAQIIIAQNNAERTAPFTAAERESVYTAAIQRRADAVITALNIQDTNKAARIHSAVVAQYRALRARDEAMDIMFRSLSSNVPGVESNRPAILPVLSRQLHEQFLKRLEADLSPDQLEIVKDIMTYNKVKVTFDAYCQIFSGLSEAEKARIMHLLKAAREEAMDGGSAAEKTAIFQKYKDQIHAYLEGNGHRVSEAYKQWEMKQAQLERMPIVSPQKIQISQ